MFNFEVLHTPGKLNPADPASRRPDYVAGKHTDGKILLLGFRSFSSDTSDICALSLTAVPRTTVDISFMPADSFTVHCLQQLYDSDALIKKGSHSFLTQRDGLWWWRDRLYVPTSFRQFLIGKFHGDPASGHWGVFRTLDLISRTFFWPQMRADILAFISSCARCQQIKVDHQKTQGELMPLPIPDRPWLTIGGDFIVKLPLSSSYDSIMVVVDHLTKSAHFIPANKTWDAMELAKQFLASVFKLHGLPDKIVSDCGATFVSRFWTAVMTQLRIQPAPSTAFHPQTDGQVERTNAILEDYLRHFVSLKQDDWSTWLPLAEFSYNNSPSSSTSHSPFFACHGFHPRFNTLTTSSVVPRADDWLSNLHGIQDHLAASLRLSKSRQAHFHNRHRRPAEHYAPGDLVWLSRRHLKTSRPCNKLDVRRVGPFRVDHMVGNNAVKLHLTPSFKRLHPVFNLSLISRFVPATDSSRESDLPIITGLADEFLKDFAVTHVLDFCRSSSGADEYLLRFGDTSGLNDAWTPLSLLPPSLFPSLLDYHAAYPYTGPMPPPFLCLSV